MSSRCTHSMGASLSLALRHGAKLEGRSALALMTMTDHLVTGARLGSDERRSTMDQMISLALEVAVRQARALGP